MKVNRLETHDRLEHFKQDQGLNIWKGASDCLQSNSLSLAMQDKSPYIYIFAHPRTAEDGHTKVMYWQPRLLKPHAETNSYLFRVASKTDVLEVCWLIPDQMMWPQYKKGNVTEHDLVNWSIDQYTNNRKALEAPDREDLSDEAARVIYKKICQEIAYEKMHTKILTPNFWEACSS